MDSWESIPGLKSLQIRAQSWVFKHSVGARSWVVIGLLYRPARLHRADGIDSWALQKFRISGSAGWRIGPSELTGSTCILHTIFTSSCRLLDRDRLTRLNWTNLTVYFSFICTFKWIYNNTPIVTQEQFWYALVAFCYRKMRHFTSFATSALWKTVSSARFKRLLFPAVRHLKFKNVETKILTKTFIAHGVMDADKNYWKNSIGVWRISSWSILFENNLH